MAPVIDARVPEWLTRRAHFTDPGVSQDIARGFQMGQQSRESRQRMAIAATDALWRQRATEVQMQATVLENAQKALVMEDTSEMMIAQKRYIGGDREAAPLLRTPQMINAWRQWRAVADAEQGEAVEWDSFMKDYAELDGYGKAAVRDIGGKWPVNRGGILPEHYQILGNEQARMRDDLLKAKYGTETIEVDGQKYIRNRSTGGLHAVPKDWSEGAPAVPIVDDDGNVLGYGLQNSRGGLTQLRPPGARRHPLQNKLDGLKADLAGAEASGFKSTKARELKAEIMALEKVIAAEQPTAPVVPQPNGPKMGDVLRYDPTTRTFK